MILYFKKREILHTKHKIQHQFQAAISHLNPRSTWEHTLTDILNHDPKTEMGIIMRAWVKDNNMTDFTSMLTYTADKFIPTGFLCYYKEKVDAETPTMMPTNLLQELYNLRRYITHVMNESDYDPDDPDFDHPLSEHNWLFQTRGKFMKYVIYNSIRWYRVKTNT